MEQARAGKADRVAGKVADKVKAGWEDHLRLDQAETAFVLTAEKKCSM